MPRQSGTRSWQPPLTMRCAVRRALDRVGGQHLDGDQLAHQLRDELHSAGYRIVDVRRPLSPASPLLEVGRPMTPAEARTFGFTLPEAAP